MIWEKYVTRRLAVQIALAWNFGWGTAMKKVYGVSVNDTLVFRDNKKTEYYVNQKQHEAYVKGLYNLLGQPKFLKNFHSNAQTVLEKILAQAQETLSTNLHNKTNRELVKIYKNFVLPNTTQFYIRMWTVFNIGEPLANVVRQHLQKYLKNEVDVTNYLLNLSSPLKPNDVLCERMDLLKLAALRKKLSIGKFKEKIGAHTAKYRHIPMFDFDHNPYTEKYFLDELKAIKNPENELKHLEQMFAKKEGAFNQTLKRLKPNKESRNLFSFLKENVFLRDYRDMIRQKFNLELRKFYGEIGTRLKLPIGQVAALTNQEIITHLQTGRMFSLTEARKRDKAYLLIQKNKNIKIYSGGIALKKAGQILKSQTQNTAKEVKGITGSPGVAKGRVKIVFTNKDLHKIKNGDIMVATMTRQDFVPAIRKAIALVTDEGSVTAHAAIIARELGLPCIVATKIGTKVFKDGDIIEVDANKGIVKIIKE